MKIKAFSQPVGRTINDRVFIRNLYRKLSSAYSPAYAKAAIVAMILIEREK